MNRIDESINVKASDLSQIFNELKRLNDKIEKYDSRIRLLENWRYGMVGAISVISVSLGMIAPSLIRLILQ